jgi:hypothetical protein
MDQPSRRPKKILLEKQNTQIRTDRPAIAGLSGMTFELCNELLRQVAVYYFFSPGDI